MAVEFYSGWHDFAACRGEDPEIFWDRHGFFPLGDIAKDICSGCPVFANCRAEIDATERTTPFPFTFGIWAGETPMERFQRRHPRTPIPRDSQRHRRPRLRDVLAAEVEALDEEEVASHRNGGWLFGAGQ